MYSKVDEISADMSVFNCLHEDIQTSSHETSEYCFKVEVLLNPRSIKMDI